MLIGIYLIEHYTMNEHLVN